MKLRYILIPFVFLITKVVLSQSGLVLGAGLSTGYADNSIVSKKGHMMNIIHGSLTGRFGADV